jgi:cytochrome c biogenesis protein CcmG, thiol:disulfide interchange protein DsbE
MHMGMPSQSLPEEFSDMSIITRPLALRAALVGLALAGLIAATLSVGGAPRAGQVGADAPDLAFATLDGAPLRLSDLEGRTVLLNFWASWCVPCRAELPALAAVAERRAEAGLTVVAVNFGEEPATARAFLTRLDADLTAVLDPEGVAAAAFAVVNLPTSVLVGPDGRVIARHVGYLNEDAVDAFVAGALA